MPDQGSGQDLPVVVIGAGPAGLSAALTLQQQADAKVLLLEQSRSIGGISRTACYRGNRIDIGGHRFFSKSEEVMSWWQSILPLQGAPSRDDIELGRRIPLSPGGPDPEQTDGVMLIRSRLSRIYFLKNFFDYPLRFSLRTLLSLGSMRTLRIALSYLWARLRPVVPEKSLEDFLVNRFGRELYGTFFRDYTQKVWGRACHEIKPEWGRQRIKGVSVSAVVRHALQKVLGRRNIPPTHTETSLIEAFHYPKFGPGQLWETVAERFADAGGTILLGHKVVRLSVEGSRIATVTVQCDGQEKTYSVSAVFSSMPVRDLLLALGEAVPENVGKIGAALCYRDFIAVGLLLDGLQIRNQTKIRTVNDLIPDNWIYVQESDVRVGRIQLFNNWSPYMVSDPAKAWLGMEYFCQEGDDLWGSSDQEIIRLAVAELVKMGFVRKGAFIDGVVIREPKAYPGYFGDGYEKFSTIREYLLGIDNLYPIGRNGMHRYNNMDHSMLTAFRSVDSLLKKSSKQEIWDINAEDDYHEIKNHDK